MAILYDETISDRAVGYNVSTGSYFKAVVKETGMVVCLSCLDYELKMKLLKGANVQGYRRIYPAEDWTYYPACAYCGMVQDYVNLVPTEEEAEIGKLLDEMAAYYDEG